ncbi:MAG TPA: YsnF/AvaK domain-containing protein, partial [Telluria sp.]|nr:YsnF/AvaK domain-containing protein [Telluria sp.]
MQHTLIAVFDNRADAEHAMDELLASGFSRQDVQISKGDPTGITDSVTGRSTSATDTDQQDEGFGASIRHFFSDIFGTDNSTHTQKYSDAVSRGHHVLTLTTESEPEVERAADIVERHGPVDIDEKHAEWAGGAGMASPESMRMSGAGGMQQSAGLSQQSASMSQDLSDDRNLYQQQSLNTAEPMGTTYQEPQGGSLQGSSLEGSAIQGGSVSGSQQRDLNRDASLAGSSLTGSSLTGSQQRDTAVSRDTDMSRAIPVVEEELKIGKREVQRGGVRIFSRLVETPVNESIGLREEHVNVERRPVDQPISPTDATAFKEQSIEMRETAEEAIVQKSARVVEEVRVGKEVSERTEQISDTVRHTEVEVEQLGAQGRLSDDDYYRQHWNSSLASSGGTYDEYAPAYRYGSESRSKYQGRDWDDVESDLRSDWDTRYGSSGGSTWEKAKAAVRHGWNKMTGDSGTSAGLGSSLRS